MSVFAIGDIHGEEPRLSALLAALPRGPEDTTVFLGDYIDRGPDSAGVVRRVLAEYDAAPTRTILLWGNHEDIAAAHFGFPAPSKLTYDPYDWFKNGGFATLASFGYPTPAEAFSAPRQEELERLFPLLKTFWRGPGNTIYVHAGVPAGERPEDTPASVLLWTREPDTDTTGRVVVHGHTPQQSGLPDIQPNRINLDTAAVYGGPLSAFQLPERWLYLAHADGEVTSHQIAL